MYYNSNVAKKYIHTINMEKYNFSVIMKVYCEGVDDDTRNKRKLIFNF